MSATNSTPVYSENTEFFMNVVNLSWLIVSVASVKLLTSHVISFPGYDWTEPYPGSIIDEGHTLGLMISDDFSVKSNGKALPMHPSWYICRHIFISTNAAMKKSGDRNTCDGLPSDCKNDLAAALTNDWGYKNADSMCSQRIADPIPQIRVGTFGFSRQGVLTHTTRFHRHLDPVGRKLAYNRTYLVVTVWGFGRGTDPTIRRISRVTWACMSGRDPWKYPVLHYYPDPPSPHSRNNSTSIKPPSSAITSSVAVSLDTTSSETISSTTTSRVPASSTTITLSGSILTKLDKQIIYLPIAMLMAGSVLDDYV
ncbi:hypothetical protein V8C34DRAFT_315285 [Trichoderma compactum]